MPGVDKPSATPEEMQRLIGYCYAAEVSHQVLKSLQDNLDGTVSND
jgi:hypothetical protein